MPNPICSVCQHPERAAIEGAYLAGDSVRRIAERYGLSVSPVSRHKKHVGRNSVPQSYLNAQSAKAVEARYLESARLESARTAEHEEKNLATATELLVEARDILKEARDNGDLKTALGGIREAVRCLELLARLEGLLEAAPTVNIFITQQWTTVQQTIVTALNQFPEARQAVVEALAGVTETEKDG